MGQIGDFFANLCVFSGLYGRIEKHLLSRLDHLVDSFGGEAHLGDGILERLCIGGSGFSLSFGFHHNSGILGQHQYFAIFTKDDVGGNDATRNKWLPDDHTSDRLCRLQLDGSATLGGQVCRSENAGSYDRSEDQVETQICQHESSFCRGIWES